MSGGEDLWKLFPFPTRTTRGVTPGALWPGLAVCTTCTELDCLARPTIAANAVTNCRYGISFLPIDDTRSAVSFIATDLPITTKSAKKARRRYPNQRTPSSSVRNAVDNARTLGAGIIDDFAAIKSEYIDTLNSDPTFHAALAGELSKDFRDNLAQSHDFLQLVKLVRGHAESLLHEKFPDLKPEEAAEKLPTEGAIYFSTSLMLLKMDALIYLNEVNRVYGSQTRFQIHPFLLKYLRIYNWQAKDKDLTIHLVGTCYTSCFYNSQAIGTVLQALLDNLVKYAPAGTDGTVTFSESDHHVQIDFRSLGPKILPNERAQIFYAKFRAIAARNSDSDGMGIGLAAARNISDALDLDLTCDQDDLQDTKHPGLYWTTFRMQLAKA